ncbi:prolyl oligopeptidase family serine peptidase [Pseudoduganella sp. LjRoot289]|uniref:S9 family peptidase n=1 Tax=Pseudoduganella sp. LjRoot289 TaxID=3342314 RepID=UPI003ECE933A
MNSKQLLTIALLLGSACGAPAHAAAPPAEHFFDNPAFSQPKLSPDGKFLAFKGSRNGERTGLYALDLASRAIKGLMQYSDVDIDDFEWVNNQRLVFDTNDDKVAPGDMTKAPGMYAINLDGGEYRVLVDRSYSPASETGSMIKQRILPYNTYLLGQRGAQDSESIYVRRAHWDEVSWDLDYFDLQRLNTLTGRAETLQRPGKVISWLLDARGEPRVAVAVQDGTASVLYRDGDGKSWRQLAAFPAYGDAPGRFWPLGFAADGKLYVSSRAGKDKEALHLYDVAKGQMAPEALVSLADYDYDGKLIYSNGNIIGLELLSDARSTVWLDERMKAVQKAIDAKLAGTVNLVRPPLRPQTPWMLVRSYSDRTPVRYYLYNADSGELGALGALHPLIDPAQMGQQDLVQVKARDGLAIPAWLTLPSGQSKKLPLVLLVHGGPFVRGSEWGWDAQAQFLASRGYAVLEPEFRGSTGFGARHFEAGWKQWGLAMQDDIADAARWAVAQGYADPQRICIAGASYGGYATLMGLARNPELFKCGVEWLGVTDLGLLYKDHWNFLSDLDEGWKQYGLPQLVGDPVRDAQQLKDTSPLNLAARITQPLLMAYGSDDRRVPIPHGRAFHAAVKAHNPDAELVVYPGEGHGWAVQKTRIDFWTRVEKFLARHIGAQAKTE